MYLTSRNGLMAGTGQKTVTRSQGRKMRCQVPSTSALSRRVPQNPVSSGAGGARGPSQFSGAGTSGLSGGMVGPGDPPGCDQPHRGGNVPRCKGSTSVAAPLRQAFGFLNALSLVDNEGHRNVSWRSGERDMSRLDNKSDLLARELPGNKLEDIRIAETWWFARSNVHSTSSSS